MIVRPALRRTRTRCEGVGTCSCAGTNERVSPLVREIVVLLEHGKLDRTKVPTDFGERGPAGLDGLDEAEERLECEQVVVLVRVAHVAASRPR